MLELTYEIQDSGGRLFHKAGADDRKIFWWFEDEKDLKDDLEWQEKKSELSEYD